MAKIVLNGCYGGYGLSEECILAVLKRKGIGIEHVEKDRYGSFTVYDTNGTEYSDYYNFARDDKDLVATVEELGEKANGSCADLFVDEYDDENFAYWIDEYDGIESLMLEPIVSEKKLIECKDVSEIITYLQSLNIVVKMMNA